MTQMNKINEAALEQITGEARRIVDTGTSQNAAVRTGAGKTYTQIDPLKNGTYVIAQVYSKKQTFRSWAQIDSPGRRMNCCKHPRLRSVIIHEGIATNARNSLAAYQPEKERNTSDDKIRIEILFLLVRDINVFPTTSYRTNERSQYGSFFLYAGFT